MTCPPLGSATLDKDDVELAKRFLESRRNWFAPDFVEQYETEFALWNGSKFAFAFMGGRVALSACIYALDLQPGDEAILPGYTCVVVPNAFHFAGINTVYSDIELDTYGLDAGKVEEKITSRTKVILLPHHYGLVCRDYEQIVEIARKHHIFVIEDCCHSTGARFRNLKVGNCGDLAFYSTEQSKVMTTIQGGVATTNNELLGKRLGEYRDSARYPDSDRIDKLLCNLIVNYYLHKDPQRWWKGDLYALLYRKKILVSTSKEEERGLKPLDYGRKMPAPLAAIGLNQLSKVEKYNKIRRQAARKWDSWCENAGYRKPTVVLESIPVFLRYPVNVEPEKKRNRSWGQEDLGVNMGVWFVSNIHPVDWPVEGCPNADKAVRECVNLPTVI